MNPRRLLLLFSLIVGVAPVASGQGVGFEVLGTVELWKSDTGSRLLARNGGDPNAYGQLYGWLAYQPTRTLRVLAIGQAYVETGHESEVEGRLDLLSLRWWRSRALRVEGGKILLPLGEFSSRRFANVNPLIGAPDTYVGEYPWGASLTGAVGAVDYMAAVVSLPAVNERYSPSPGNQLRPAASMGFSVGPQFRIGVGGTHGPYLNENLAELVPAGKNWNDFTQTVITGDLRYSAGRFDTRVEAVWSSYDVPTVADAVTGLGWYAETRATITPRLFVAARYEHNKYPFVMPVSANFWVGTATTQENAEAGLGYRLSPDALVKTSLRKDHWPVHQIGPTSFPDGYAFAVQFSVHADVMAAFSRKP